MLLEIKSVAEKQAHPTQNTQAALIHLLEYAATNHNTVVNFMDIDMVIYIDSYES